MNMNVISSVARNLIQHIVEIDLSFRRDDKKYPLFRICYPKVQ